MRTFVILAALALVVPLMPAAEATHMGPCWHEYVDNYKHLVQTVKSCNQGLLEWACTAIVCTHPLLP